MREYECPCPGYDHSVHINCAAVRERSANKIIEDMHRRDRVWDEEPGHGESEPSRDAAALAHHWENPNVAPEPGHDDIEVIVFSPEEWDKALQRSLDKLGLNWEQLVEQARHNDFSSLDARKLWLMAGHRGRDVLGHDDSAPPPVTTATAYVVQNWECSGHCEVHCGDAGCLGEKRS